MLLLNHKIFVMLAHDCALNPTISGLLRLLKIVFQISDMTRHLARHFAAMTQYPTGVIIPNQLRHLDLPVALAQAKAFCHELKGWETFHFLGYSEAIRTRYSLALVTLGATNVAHATPELEIPHLFPQDGEDRSIMEVAYKQHGGDLSKYSPTQIAAVDRLGKLGAGAIREAEKAAGFPKEGETDALYFGHAPTLNAIVGALIGTSLAEEPKLRFNLMEGERFIVKENGDWDTVAVSPGMR